MRDRLAANPPAVTPSTLPSMNAPNGWISHDLLIWNELDKRGFVAKGLVLEVPDLRHAGDRALNSFYESVRQFLHTLEESTRAQFHWSVDSAYREELLSYKAITDERCEPDLAAQLALKRETRLIHKYVRRSKR